MKCYRPRAKVKIEDQFVATFSQPAQVPAAATFCGAIGSGWQPIEPDPDHRELVDLWLKGRQPKLGRG